jgi:hypothetical protein
MTDCIISLFFNALLSIQPKLRKDALQLLSLPFFNHCRGMMGLCRSNTQIIALAQILNRLIFIKKRIVFLARLVLSIALG